MSYSVSTGRVETSPGQNHSGSVSVAVRDGSAGFAHENPFRQQQAGLGSRAATAACHCRVGGRHQHHLSARPRGILDQRCLGGSDSAVRGLARHPRLGQECGFEVLNSEETLLVDDAAGPLARRVAPLPGDLLGHLGDSMLGGDVAFGSAFAFRRLPPRPCALPARQLFGCAFPCSGCGRS